MTGVGTKSNIPKSKALELRYTPILDAYSFKPTCYKTTTVVYSKLMGTLVEADYMYAADYGNETGVKLSEWNIGEVARHSEIFRKQEYEVEFITAKCTSSFAALDDAGKRVEAILNKFQVSDPSRICLEFPQSVLFHSGDNGRKTIMDMKVLGVKTMVSGCGTSEGPMSRFMTMPVDYALLDSSTTSLIRDRNNPGVLDKFIGYLNSMKLKVIADGVDEDEEFRQLTRMDCLLVIPSKNYQGNAECSTGDLSVDEALSQKGVD